MADILNYFKMKTLIWAIFWVKNTYICKFLAKKPAIDTGLSQVTTNLLFNRDLVIRMPHSGKQKKDSHLLF